MLLMGALDGGEHRAIGSFFDEAERGYYQN